jgi:hypothetical protein
MNINHLYELFIIVIISTVLNEFFIKVIISIILYES